MIKNKEWAYSGDGTGTIVAVNLAEKNPIDYLAVEGHL